VPRARPPRLRVAASRYRRFAIRSRVSVPVALTWNWSTDGAAATKELVFTGEPLGAEARFALGLVNRAVAAADRAGSRWTIAHNAHVGVQVDGEMSSVSPRNGNVCGATTWKLFRRSPKRRYARG
jgi:enoyl-CoA hydratase/carnithine racemase